MAESTAEAPDEGHAREMVTDSEQWAKARSQQLLATDGLAEGQCPHCGSYRIDGMRPILHVAGCPDERWWAGRTDEWWNA